MSKKEKVVQYNLGLNGIKILDFSLKDMDNESYDKIRDYIKANIETSLEVLPEENIVYLTATVRYRSEKNTASKMQDYVLLRTKFEFFVSPLKDLVKIEKAKDKTELIYLANYVSMNLAGVAYSTIRGVLFEKLRGTIFDSALLPVKDVRDLIPISNED